MSVLPIQKITSWFSPRQFIGPGGYAEIWHITWPLILMNAANTIMLLCNRAFLAYNSTTDVAAAVPAGQFFFTMMSFFLITCSFTATLVAQNYGSKDRIACVRSVWNGFYFGLCVAAVLGLLLPIAGSALIKATLVPDEIKSQELLYFAAISPCAGLACMETAFLSFFTGCGKTKVVAWIKLGACIISVPLNYILIFGKLGFPAFGIVGAGLASTTASLFSTLAAVLAFLLYNQKDFPTRNYRTPDLNLIKKLLFFGTPGGFQVCLRNAVFAVVIMMIGILGDVPLTAAGLAMTINMLAFIPLFGLMDATSVITGKYIGERRLLVAGRILWRSLRLLYVYMFCTGILYVFFPDLLIGMFASPNATRIDFTQVTQQVRIILFIQIGQNFFDGLRFIVTGALRGAGDTKIPLYLSIATSWFIQFPMAYLLIMFFHAPLWLVWAGSITLYVVVDSLVMLWRRNTGAWKTIRVVDNLPPPPAIDPDGELETA